MSDKPYRPKPDTGSMFKNRDKQSEKHADRNGSACIVCPHCGKETEYWMNSWNSVSPKGTKYDNIRFKAKAAKPATSGDTDGDVY